jgi:hypothetical protein
MTGPLNLHTTRRSTFVLVLSAFLLLGSAPALAVVNEISNCDANVDPDVNCTSNNCKLVADIDCDSDNNEKITLANGNDLDLNGYDISCATGVDCTTPIVITGSGSIVKNTGAPTSKIAGAFDVGVDCGGYSNTKVLGITLELTDDQADGIIGCRVVENNVVRWTGSSGHGSVGILVEDAANSRVGENYVAGKWWTGIFHQASSSNASTDHNVVVLEDKTFVIQMSIWGNGTSGSVIGNVLFGGALDQSSDFLLTLNSLARPTVAGNQCDPSQDSCQECISEWACMPHPASAPFTVP